MTDKPLVQCNHCKHSFFTNKIPSKSKSVILKETNKLGTELVKFEAYHDELESELFTLKQNIKSAKESIINIKKDIRALRPTVQCSNCGERINALENQKVIK